MIVNKRCISAFARTQPFVALATKSKLFDPSFSLTSELVLINYITGKVYPPVTTDLKFCKILWCETPDALYLAAGHENGVISIYELTKDGLVLLKSKACVEEDITALDYLPSKTVLVAGSCKGHVFFWTLTDLDKEYTLDVSLSAHITALAWNPKVTKILCVGTDDGIIKVLDIKKNSVIMTLHNRDISTVRHVEWDAENNTRLLVMGEQPFLCAFDLSNDSVCRIGAHSDPLIAFRGDMLVSKNLIERGAVKVATKDAFGCSISSRDPVVALSYVDGTTEVLAVPVALKRLPFFRQGGTVYSCASMAVQKAPLADPSASFTAKQICIECDAPSSAEDAFYDQLVKMVRERAGKEAIVEFLLSNAEGAPENPAGWIDVRLGDSDVAEIVHGDLSSMQQSDKSVSLRQLYGVMKQDEDVLRDISDFPTAFLLARMTGSYAILRGVRNARILCTLALLNDVPASALSLGGDGPKGGEFDSIMSILNRDVNAYIASRTSPGESLIASVASIGKTVCEMESIIAEERVSLNSDAIVDYFWYKVLIGEHSSVKNLNISNRGVLCYNRAQENPSPIRGQAQAQTRQSMPGATGGKPFSFQQKDSFASAAAHQPTPDSKINTAGINRLTVGQRPAADSVQAPAPSASFNAPPASPAMPRMSQPVPGPAVGFNPPMAPPAMSRMGQAAPVSDPNATAGQSKFNAGWPSGAAPSFPSRPMPGQARTPQMPSSMPNAPGMPSAGVSAGAAPSFLVSPLNRPITAQQAPTRPTMPSPNFSTSFRQQTHADIPQSPMAPQQPTPPSMHGRSMMDGFARRTTSPSMAPRPAAENAYAAPANTIPFDQPHAHVQSSTPPVDPSAVAREFDDFVSVLRDRAAAKNSLIIRQKKNQYLAALATYDSVNKGSLPPELLEAMHRVAACAQSVDAQTKREVDTIVSPLASCVWLKAAAELVKMLY
ncbi:hypothetical protein PAPHI01_1807 [Pancytospora philotis]|nr:hypothetical protein PAPHI01_1807 [Pancytospora philotis]